LSGELAAVGSRTPPTPPWTCFSLTTQCSASAAVNGQSNEGVAIKKVTNVFSKKILAKRALREIKLLQHFRGHRNVSLLPAADFSRGGCGLFTAKCAAA
jgi:hypothetical protein